VSAAFALVVLGSLLLDPAIWLDDYPPDVRAAVGDSIQQPRVLQGLVGALLAAVVLGGLVWSLRRLNHELGALGFRQAGLHAFLMFWIVNAVDVVVVDWLFFMRLLQSRVVFPGTEGLPGYDDYLFHLEGSFLTLPPWVGSAVLSLVVGAGWWLFVTRRGADEDVGVSAGD